MSKNELLASRLTEVNSLHEDRKSKPGLSQALIKLKTFEKNRLLNTYDDLKAIRQYSKAIDFMANDIFGADFSQRDKQMQKAYPTLIKLLPEPVLDAVGVAVQLNINLVKYENILLDHLFRANGGDINEGSYCQAFLQGRCDALRKTLIEHVRVVGEDLDHIVHKPFISTTLRLCRGPANLAGLGLLQDFLERGHQAFKVMKNSRDFMQTFTEREFQIVRNILQAKIKPFKLS